MWWIWRSRCQDIFQPADSWSDVKVAGLSRALNVELLSLNKGTVFQKFSVVTNFWSPPPMDYCKVDCDASIFRELHLVGFGCVLRNALGSWILGCNGTCPVWSIFRCKLLAIWNGLMLAWEAGCKKDLLCRNWEVNFSWINREAKSVADCLTKKGAHSNTDYCLWNASSDELDKLLRSDSSRID
ncbi:hypothetical protein PIB30_068327 [Stylosanthes scabra]|uniref:RNase H type-1 domain-containing protein n=1 Tax=Stylosanthes scabra TaxID=79078 RepID=A0ABU6VLE6_9FABA|nr:hypothetical protein [Stylosanthes scabra]